MDTTRPSGRLMNMRNTLHRASGEGGMRRRARGSNPLEVLEVMAGESACFLVPVQIVTKTQCGRRGHVPHVLLIQSSGYHSAGEWSGLFGREMRGRRQRQTSRVKQLPFRVDSLP
jgi:hypothetical protein